MGDIRRFRGRGGIRMKRIYHPYYLWEDDKNGMYDFDEDYTRLSEIEMEELAIKAKLLLCNKIEFFAAAMEVITHWKYSSEQNLSNKSRNRQAWIGQASCNIRFKIPEYITKYGWRLMSPQEQKEANKIADKIIKIWEEKNDKEISGQQRL